RGLPDLHSFPTRRSSDLRRRPHFLLILPYLVPSNRLYLPWRVTSFSRSTPVRFFSSIHPFHFSSSVTRRRKWKKSMESLRKVGCHCCPSTRIPLVKNMAGYRTDMDCRGR